MPAWYTRIQHTQCSNIPQCKVSFAFCILWFWWWKIWISYPFLSIKCWAVLLCIERQPSSKNKCKVQGALSLYSILNIINLVSMLLWFVPFPLFDNLNRCPLEKGPTKVNRRTERNIFRFGQCHQWWWHAFQNCILKPYV